MQPKSNIPKVEITAIIVNCPAGSRQQGDRTAPKCRPHRWHRHRPH
ncbi:MAG: hypothetical protein MUC60_14945 [Oscillatoria sp. Prado101]|nr:hypothetical protein [Oscillatoria sp. Prado101]